MHGLSTTLSALMFWLEIKPGGAVKGSCISDRAIRGATRGECSIYRKRKFISWGLSWEGDLRVDCSQDTVLEFGRFLDLLLVGRLAQW